MTKGRDDATGISGDSLRIFSAGEANAGHTYVAGYAALAYSVTGEGYNTDWALGIR